MSDTIANEACSNCGHPNRFHTDWWDDEKFGSGGMGCTHCSCDDYYHPKDARLVPSQEPTE